MTFQRKLKVGLRLYQTGKSLRAASDECGVSVGALHKAAIESGVVRKKGHIQQQCFDQVKDLYKTHSADEISVILGIPKGRVYQSLAANGVEIRSKSDAFKLAVEKGTHVSASRGVNTLRALLQKTVGNMTWPEYKRLAVKITAAVVRQNGEQIQGYRKDRKYPDWHVDHQLSVYNGYFVWSDRYQCFERRSRPVPFRILCHVHNLRVVRSSTNATKHRSSTLTLQELRKRIKQ
jgi:hypothetical protein